MSQLAPAMDRPEAPWHAVDAEAARAALGTPEAGLAVDEAARRLAAVGPNVTRARARGRASARRRCSFGSSSTR